jgi:hypothetical protein
MRDDLISEQIRVMEFWRLYLFIMYGLHYILGLASVVLAVTVASKPFHVSKDDNLYDILGGYLLWQQASSVSYRLNVLVNAIREHSKF